MRADTLALPSGSAPALGAALLCLSLVGAPLRAMGLFPSPQQRALWTASDDFRAGDLSASAAVLDAWVRVSPQAAREDLAARFLAQDFAGVLALDVSEPARDDEARLWVARSDAALARWQDCLSRLGRLDRPERPWALVLRAEALTALGDPASGPALDLALSATASTRLEAMAALDAAEAAAARGDEASEEAFYLRAERADPAYSMVDLRLAELYLCQERWQDARLRLERACRVAPWAQEPRQDLDALLQVQPQQRAAQSADEEGRLDQFLQRANPRVDVLVRAKGEPLVRVGLIPAAEAVSFRLGGDMVDEAGGLTLAAGSTWVACADSGTAWTLAPLDPNPACARVLSAPLRLRPLDPAGTFGIFGVEHGTGYFFAGRKDRYYRGLLEIGAQRGALLVVDELGMEAYLRGVVPSEVPATWSPAALRAQAIAARTYALGELGSFKREGYDLCPTVACAVYSGVDVERDSTNAAVSATAGLVLQDGKGRLSSAHYMDDAGGHTLASDEVWPGSDPDSVGVADCPDSAVATRKLFPLSPAGLLHFIDDLDDDVRGWTAREGSSTWRWTLRLTPEEMAPALARLSPPLGRLRTVLGLERSDGGYLKRVRIVGEAGQVEVKGDAVRTALKGLKSNLFYVEPRFDAQGRTLALLFHGGGWGHGVGMSQSGAEAMAQASLDEGAILRHYFPKDRIHARYTR